MKIKEKWNFITRLNQLFDKKEKREFLFIMMIVLFMSFFQALGIASVFPFISLIMNPNIIFESEKLSWFYNFSHCTEPRYFIFFVGVITVILIVVGNLLTALAIWLKSRFVWRKSHHLSTDMLRQYLFSPYSYFLTRNSADLGKNILMEVQTLTRNFMMPVLEIITDVVLVAATFLMLMMISPLPTLIISLVAFGFYGVLYHFGLRRDLKVKGSKRPIENTARFKAVLEALGGIKEIKLLGREPFFLEKFKWHSLLYSNLNCWHEIVMQVPRYLIEMIAFGSVVIFVLILISSDKDIKQVIPIVSFLTFAGYRLMPVINKMFQAFTSVRFNTAMLDSIHKDLHPDRETEILSQSDVVHKIEFENEIGLSDVSFLYTSLNNYILKEINLTIKKNTSVAIVGPTGGGKTTLVDIVLGLLDPTKGNIYVDEVKINVENIRAWQKMIGYVPQFIYLSDDTIRRNIAFGLTDGLIDNEKVEIAAKIAHLHDFIIDTLPNSYDTIVGERGIRLSGGQRQRVGIARALYNDPDVLVFDEATSSLDGVTEDVVLRAIEDIAKLKTLIVVAHRLTTVQKCDIIYVLDKGRIVAQGKYEELIKNNLQFQAMALGDTKQIEAT